MKITILALVIVVLSNASVSAETRTEGTKYCYRKDKTLICSPKFPEGVPKESVRAIKYSFRSPGPAPAGYRYLASSESSDTYVKETSILKRSSGVSAWVLDSYDEEQVAINGSKYLSTLRRITISCPEHAISTEKVVYTSGKNGAGTYVSQWAPLSSGVRDFSPPGSVDDAVATALCK